MSFEKKFYGQLNVLYIQVLRAIKRQTISLFHHATEPEDHNEAKNISHWSDSQLESHLFHGNENYVFTKMITKNLLLYHDVYQHFAQIEKFLDHLATVYQQADDELKKEIKEDTKWRVYLEQYHIHPIRESLTPDKLKLLEVNRHHFEYLAHEFFNNKDAPKIIHALDVVHKLIHHENATIAHGVLSAKEMHNLIDPMEIIKSHHKQDAQLFKYCLDIEKLLDKYGMGESKIRQFEQELEYMKHNADYPKMKAFYILNEVHNDYELLYQLIKKLAKEIEGLQEYHNSIPHDEKSIEEELKKLKELKSNPESQLNELHQYIDSTNFITNAMNLLKSMEHFQWMKNQLEQLVNSKEELLAHEAEFEKYIAAQEKQLHL